MRLFHITGNENVEAILKDGFRDSTSYFRSDLVEIQDGFGNIRPAREYAGVWVSDEPDEGYIHGRNTIVAIEIPEDVISGLEWVEAWVSPDNPGHFFNEMDSDGNHYRMHYRQWLIPAELLNSYGPPLVTNPRDWVEDYDMLGGFTKVWEKDRPEVLDPPSNDWIDKPADWMDK